MQLFKLNKMFFNYKISSKICRKKFFSNSNGPGNNTKNIETKTSIEQTINSKLNLNAINPVSAQAKEEEKQYLFGPISKDLRDYYNIKDKNSQYFIPKSTVGKIERDFGEKVSESMRKALSFDNASQRELNKWYYFQIAKYFGKSPNDTASYEVQGESYYCIFNFHTIFG